MSSSAWLILGLATLAALLMGRWLMTGRYLKTGDVTRLALRSAPFTVPISVGLVLLACWWLPPDAAAVTAVTVVFGVAVSWIDIDVQRIPNRLLMIWAPIQAAGLLWAASLSGNWWRLLGAAAGGAVLGGSLCSSHCYPAWGWVTRNWPASVPPCPDILAGRGL